MHRLIKEICVFCGLVGVELLIEYLWRGENADFSFLIITSIFFLIAGIITEFVIYNRKKKGIYFYGNPIKFFMCTNYCPICNSKLIIKTNHKIVPFHSKESKKYSDFFEDFNGHPMINELNKNIKHKVFYCSNCDLELEKVTVFSYNNMIKKLNKLKKKAERKKNKLDITFIYKATAQPHTFLDIDKVAVRLSKRKKDYEKIVFITKNREKYEQAKYFEQT